MRQFCIRKQNDRSHYFLVQLMQQVHFRSHQSVSSYNPYPNSIVDLYVHANFCYLNHKRQNLQLESNFLGNTPGSDPIKKQLPFIGSVTARRLIEKLGDAEKIYQAGSEQLAEISDLSVRQRESIIRNHSLEKAKRIFEECQNKNIFVLCWDDDRYPARAKKPTDAPVVLYYKGNFREMDQTIGIIGARRCSQESKQKTVFLASECAQKKITVVSGMAKGIDSYAHTVCLNTGGYTVAILGNGLDICYPAEHNKLMKCIEEKGLLISEYPPGTHPDRYRFPRRNRLISSWSDKLFVIQAEKGSGALITAEYSRKYGREVEME